MAELTEQQKQAKAQADAETKAQAAPATFTGQLPYEAFRAQQTMSDIEQGRALQMDQTTKGGAYLNDAGVLVNADGVPLKDAKG